MATMLIGTLKEGNPIREQVVALIKLERKETREGKPYLEVQLGDISGQCVGRRFDVDPGQVDFAPGDAVIISGTYSQRYGINLDSIRKAGQEIDPADFIPASRLTRAQLAEELDAVIDSLTSSPLRSLCHHLLQEDRELRDKFLTWPGAQQVHHAFLGGLAEHSLSVARMCDEDARRYEQYGLNRDLMVTGGLLHDLGKIEDYRLGASIIATRHLTLATHLYTGTRMVEEAAARILDFPTDLKEHLVHIMLSHHGKPEHNSPVTPTTLEAYLVYSNDYKDGKANRYFNLISSQRQAGIELGSKDYFLGTRLYAPALYTPEDPVI